MARKQQRKPHDKPPRDRATPRPEQRATSTLSPAAWWWNGVAFGAIALACLVVYSRGLANEFSIWDDRINVVDNPLLHPVSATNLRTIWQEPYKGLYAPVSYTFFAAETWLAERLGLHGTRGNERAEVFHAGSLLLHIAVCWLVYVLLAKLIRHRGAACLAALLFALHPLQVESVAWVTETRGLLAAVAGLFAIWQYLNFAESDIADVRRWGRFVLATVAFTVAVLAKPSAVVVPLLAALLQVCVLRQSWRRTAWLGAWIALGIGVLAVTWHQQAETIVDTAAPLARPLLALDALAFYLFKVVVPWPLAADYGWRPSVLVGQWWFYALWLLPAAIAGGLAWRRQIDFWLVGLLWFALALLPVLGLVPFSFQYVSTVADRYAYLAMFGVAWIVAALVARYWGAAAIGIAGAVIALCAGLSWWQVGIWKNDETLFTHALSVNDQSFAALTNLGRWRAMHGQLNDALADYRQAIEIYDLNPVTHYCLGHALMTQRQYAEAATELARAAELNARDPDARNLRGEAFLMLGQVREAQACFADAQRLAPKSVIAAAGSGKALAQLGDFAGAERDLRSAIAFDNESPHPAGADAHLALGLLLANRHRFNEAAAELAIVVQRRPNDAVARYRLADVTLQSGRAAAAAEMFAALVRAHPDLLELYNGLAQSLLMLGKTGPALDQYRQALARKPDWVAGQLSLAWLLATLPEDQFRSARDAVVLAERACTSTDRKLALALDVLAAARAEAGDFAGAAEAAEQALKLAPGQLSATQTREVELRRDLYRSGKPFRKAPAPASATTQPSAPSQPATAPAP
jgi:tetratricopeptide (TPR) repeat protein